MQKRQKEQRTQDKFDIKCHYIAANTLTLLNLWKHQPQLDDDIASAGSCAHQAPACLDPRHTWCTHPRQHPAFFPDHWQRTRQGFYTSEAQGHLWIKAKHSIALVWEHFCTLWMQGPSNGGNWSYHGSFPQSWYQVGMFLFTPCHKVQEKSNATTLISLCGQIVFNELRGAKPLLEALSLFPIKSAATVLALSVAQPRFFTNAEHPAHPHTSTLITREMVQHDFRAQLAFTYSSLLKTHRLTCGQNIYYCCWFPGVCWRLIFNSVD